MKNNIIMLVLVLAVVAGAAYSQMSTTALGNPVTKIGQTATYATTSLSTTVASTTAVTVSALSGRDYIEIRSGPTAGEEIWVGIDTTPTITTGICVNANNPLRLPLSASSVVKTIASGAFKMAVFQGAY